MTGAALPAGLAGAGFAAGLLLIVSGLRPVEVDTGHRDGWRTRLRLFRRVWPGRYRAAAAATAGVGVLAVTGWPVAALAAGGGVVAVPRLLSGRTIERQLVRLEAVEAWTRRLGDILASGAGGLEQAIVSSTRSCPAAIQDDVARLAERLPVDGVETALRRFADDLADTGSPAADIVAAALILRLRRGGRGLRPVLAALADDIGDLVRGRRATEADRAKPRANVRTLVLLTAVVLAATVVFARPYLVPFGTAAGQMMLGVIALVFAAGLVLMARIARPPTAMRVLSAPATADGQVRRQ